MNELEIKENIKIENMIYEVRGKQVMLDSDLARLYKCANGTKDINKAVKRNIERFPDDFYFQLNATDIKENINLSSRFHFGTLKMNRGNNLKYMPKVFTEQGVAMLATVLKTPVASKMSVAIMRAFVTMRKYISTNLIEQININNMVLKHDNEIRLLQESFSKFEEKDKSNEIYFDGQIYDAYSKIKDIFNEAKKELIIVDAYADKSTLDLIRNLNINVTLIVKNKTLLTKTDINKYNSQYNNLKIIYNDTFHDRYFILDKKIVYHSGTSINHAGSKTFSLNKLEDNLVKETLINKIYNIINPNNIHN